MNNKPKGKIDKTAKPKKHTNSVTEKKSLRLRDLKGFGPKSEEILAQVGIHSVDDFMAVESFELYRSLKATVKGTGLNSIYAIIGAREDRCWKDVAKTQRAEIVLRLDDMGLAPK